MCHLGRPALFAAWITLLALAGCERAAHYPAVRKETGPDGVEKPEPKRPRAPAGYAWLEPRPGPDVAIEFVSAATDPAGWKRLEKFWNHIRSDELTPALVASAIGRGPLDAAAAAFRA